MSQACSVLDFSVLRPALGAVVHRFDIIDLAECASTNSELLQRAGQGAPSGTVVIADVQTAGRGRLGRTWHSDAASSLTFSLWWKFPPETALSGLSLAVGVAIAQGLEDLGVAGGALKWPNDIWLQGRKLGGVLIELQFQSGHAGAVIGIGLNLRRHPAWEALVEQAWAALSESGLALSREQVLAAVLVRLQQVLDHFAGAGFDAALRAEWMGRNALQGQRVRVEPRTGEQRFGCCLGVAEDGALLLAGDDGICERVTVGDVSLRPAGAP